MTRLGVHHPILVLALHRRGTVHSVMHVRQALERIKAPGTELIVEERRVLTVVGHPTLQSPVKVRRQEGAVTAHLGVQIIQNVNRMTRSKTSAVEVEKRVSSGK